MAPLADRAPRRLRLFGAGSRAGFSLSELIVLVAVIGLLFAMSIPFFVRYYQATAVQSASQQVIALFNRARELAIQQNNNVCVHLSSGTQMQFVLNTCGGTVWVGAGTDATGNFNLPAGFTVSPPTDVVFNYLGAATPSVTYTVTNSSSGTTLTISIALTGRVTSP